MDRDRKMTAMEALSRAARSEATEEQAEGPPKMVSRRRMGKMFECATEICVILDHYSVEISEECHVRRFVEDLWQRPK
uniref:Uncharacterized protein n=1 Tax=viral metagenome TaxID=1070528 RepID=A0A6H1ZJB4_9ZZZZ